MHYEKLSLLLKLRHSACFSHVLHQHSKVHARPKKSPKVTLAKKEKCRLGNAPATL